MLLCCFFLFGTTAIATAQPTTVCFKAVADATLNEAQATTNYGSDSTLVASRWTNTPGVPVFKNKYGLFRFALAAIPADAIILTAQLTLKTCSFCLNSKHQDLSAGNGNTTIIQQVTSTWDEQTVTWSTKPTVTSTNQVFVNSLGHSSSLPLSANVTEMVQNMVQSSNFGFQLKLANNADYLHRVNFAARENGDISIVPELCITYVLPPKFHYTVDCSNTIQWTIDDNRGFSTSFAFTNQNGINITNLSTPPVEGDSITLTCTNSMGQTISKMQVFTMKDCMMPTYTYIFNNNGTSFNIPVSTGKLAPSLFYSADQGTTYLNLHPTTTPNTIYNDFFPVSSATQAIDICVKAIYSGLGGNALNTVCKTLCRTIAPQDCAIFNAYFVQTPLSSATQLKLTASGIFVPTTTAAAALATPPAVYKYVWSNSFSTASSTSSSIILNPNNTATYTVTVTTDRGCSATASISFPAIQGDADIISCIEDSKFCMPVKTFKPLINTTSLFFTFQITGKASFDYTLPSLLDITVPGTIVPTNYTINTSPSGPKLVSVKVDRGVAGTTGLNTRSLLPNMIGCLGLKLDSTAQVGDTILITGRVTESYGAGVGVQNLLFPLSPMRYIINCLPTEEAQVLNNTADFTISPNPVTATDAPINIILPTDSFYGETIVLYDILGNVLQKNRINNTVQTIDLGAYPKGVYIVNIGYKSKKIIKS